MSDEIAYSECVAHYGKKVYKIYPLVIVGIGIILFGIQYGLLTLLDSLFRGIAYMISYILTTIWDIISPLTNILSNVFNFIIGLIISGIQFIIPILISIPSIVYIGFGVVFGPILCVMIYCLSRRVSIGYQLIMVISSLPIGVIGGLIIMQYINAIIGFIIFGCGLFLPIIWAGDLGEYNRSRKCVKKD